VPRNRDGATMQAKLDALVHAVKKADARFITRFAPQMIRICKQRDESSVTLNLFAGVYSYSQTGGVVASMQP